MNTTEVLLKHNGDPTQIDWSWIDKDYDDIGVSIYNFGFIGYYKNKKLALSAIKNWIEEYGFLKSITGHFKIQLSIVADIDIDGIKGSARIERIYFNGTNIVERTIFNDQLFLFRVT